MGKKKKAVQWEVARPTLFVTLPLTLLYPDPLYPESPHYYTQTETENTT